MAARESYISGRRGIGELTGTVQSCVSLWENAFAIAQVDGTDVLRPRELALLGRSLALRGEAVFFIREDGRLLPASDWDFTTRDGIPRAYRLSIAEAGGGRPMTALAPEVLHFVTGADMVAPYNGQAPLRRANLTASLLHALESALTEVYELGPLGSQIVPFPENPHVDNEQLSRGFRGRRGSVLLRESVNVTAAGGPAPQTDWQPRSVTPDLRNAMTAESLAAARDTITATFGVLPGLFSLQTTGPLVREAQRHLVQFTLQPMAEVLAQESSDKLGAKVSIDLVSPLQAFDQGGRARAFATLIDGLTAAKEAGLSPAHVQAALQFIDERPAE
jgi:hypothetical protein